MQDSRLAWLMILAATSTAVAAQQTWIVDSARGAGWQFEAIQPAVDAAAPGDTILVRGGAGTQYQGATIRKGVTISAVGSVSIITTLRIDGVPTGERAALVGLAGARVVGQMFGEPISDGRIECSACLGTVHLERVSMTGSSFGPGLAVDNCAQVSAVDCQLASGVTSYFHPNLNRVVLVGSGLGLRATNSAVALVHCHAPGVAWRNGSGFLQELAVRPAITVTNGRLLAVDSLITGGGAWCDGTGSFCLPFAAPEPGVIAQNSILTVRRSTVSAGTRQGCTTCPPDNIPPIRADAATTTQPTDADLSATGGTPGQSLQIVLNSSIAAPFATYLSLPAPVIPAPVGFWLDQQLAIPIAFGVAPIGTRVDVLGVPSSVPIGLPLGLQAVLLSQGQVVLSAPTVKVLL